jgi:predicted Na+-dependent transporter
MPSTSFGVRQFVNILLYLLRFYMRHQVNIDARMSTMPNERDALHILVAAYTAIEELNKPGPS